MKITCAVHHIPLAAANPGKQAKLDALAAVYLPLVQQYVTRFCTEAPPAKFAPPCFESPLSERWQRGAILKKKGVKHLPSTRCKKLARTVRQDINRAVSEVYAAYPAHQIAYECLNRAGMKFAARALNAYLYASNLGHIPAQLAWDAKRGGRCAIRVKSAYSSQEYSRCHYTDRANRPTQQTFCCAVCEFTSHADSNAAINLASRLGDWELAACQSHADIKALLGRRHEAWVALQRVPIVHPPAEAPPSTGAGQAGERVQQVRMFS